MPEDESLSPEEQQILEEAMKSYGAPTAEEKHNVHTFLNTVSKSKDTTKTGNLGIDELGHTFYSLRSYKMFNNDCIQLVKDDLWAEYFSNCGEILSATSLSKEGFLMRQATTQTRQIADVTPREIKPNKGWFKPKPAPTNNTTM